MVIDNGIKGKEYNLEYDYIEFEGEYLNNEINGKGKEYFFDSIFEGEYLKGKRNGQGKEYYLNANLKYEGEYKNGKKWTGKGYDPNNNLIYELKEGKGYIKEYTYDGFLEIEGEYSKGELNGKGKEYFIETNKIRFEGYYKNGKRNGEGKEYYYNGKSSFEGKYLYGYKWNGEGYDIEGNKIYTITNGNGNNLLKEYSNSGELLKEYEHLNGGINGNGTEYSNNKVIFKGNYINGERYGKGTEYDLKGNIMFEGEYYNNEKFRGKEYVNTKLEYEGEYFHGIKWNGKGYNINGKIIYELINGTGPVKIFKNNILIFEGSYVKGKKNGYAKVYYDTGELKFEGEYKNNKKNGKGKRYDKKKGLIYDGVYLKGKKWNGVYKPHDKLHTKIYKLGKDLKYLKHQ